MSGQWTYLTPIEVLITTVIVTLFIMRMYTEKLKTFGGKLLNKINKQTIV